MSLVLDPASAEDLHEFDSAYIFMDAQDLEDERRALADCLPPCLEIDPHDVALDDEVALIRAVCALPPQGELHSYELLRHALAQLSDYQIRLFSKRLRQVRDALQHTQACRGSDWKPTRTFAVSPLWSQRWETILSGSLRPAFVVFLDVTQFAGLDEPS